MRSVAHVAHPPVTRRAFVQLVVAGAGALAAACGPIRAPATQPTQPSAPTAPLQSTTPAGAAAAATAVSAAPTVAKRGGRLTYALLGGIVNFDSHRFGPGSPPVFNLLYNTLITYDKNLQPQPELAESWQFSDNGRTLTLKLRPGVKFHSGREFVSEDVKFNIERVQNPKTAAHAGPLVGIVDKVETPDKQTVVMRLKKVAPNVFDLLNLTYIIEPESVPNIEKKGIGTGPFQLQDWRPAVRAQLVRYPNYFKSGLPLLDEVAVDAAGDPASLVIGLESGSIDVVERPPTPEIARIKNAQGLRVYEVWGGAASDLLVNTRKKPFDNRLVRQALNRAVNRRRMVDVTWSGIGEPWCLPFPPNSIAYNAEAAAQCSYDPADGKRLLEQAGLGSGFEFELLTSSTSLPWGGTVAQIFQADLGSMGVRPRILDVEAVDYRDRTWGNKYEVAIHSYGRANLDPDTLFRTARAWYVKDNFAGFESPEFTRLVEEAGSTLDVEKRKALYKELARLIVDEAFVITISSLPGLYASRARVQGLTFNTEAWPVFEHISLA